MNMSIAKPSAVSQAPLVGVHNSRILRQTISQAVSALFVSCSWGKRNAHGPDLSEQCPDAANLQNGRAAAHRQAYLGDYTSIITIAQKEVKLVPPQR